MYTTMYAVVKNQMTKVSSAKESTSLFDAESTFVAVECRYTKTQYSDMILSK